jgi:hypothetical protein
MGWKRTEPPIFILAFAGTETLAPNLPVLDEQWDVTELAQATLAADALYTLLLQDTSRDQLLVGVWQGTVEVEDGKWSVDEGDVDTALYVRGRPFAGMVAV